LPDKIRDKINAALGKAASRAHITHFQREIFQAAWLILIQDPEFLDAYLNGIIVDCIDGIKHRLFPRFFVYSADYPEKSVISSPPLSDISPIAGSRLRHFMTSGCFLVLGVQSQRSIFQNRQTGGQNRP
jgi:hypothetical protein